MSRTIRNLDLPKIATLLDWAAAEGWNPGLDDAVAFHAADPTGFFGCFVDGTMVAGISAVAYDDDFGFIGLYICHPDWRGQGHGKAVWDAGIAYLGNRTIGLDGVPEQQANYASMGFVAAYETVRLHGVLEPRIGDGIQPASSLDEIVELDRQCFPPTALLSCSTGLVGPTEARSCDPMDASVPTPYCAPVVTGPRSARYLPKTRQRRLSFWRLIPVPFTWTCQFLSTPGWRHYQRWALPGASARNACIAAQPQISSSRVYSPLPAWN